MDDTEDDARYLAIPFGGGIDTNASGSTQQPKIDDLDVDYPHIVGNRYDNADIVEDENNEDEENGIEVEEYETVENNGSVGIVRNGEIDTDGDNYEDDNDNNVDDDDDVLDDDVDDDDVDDDDDIVGFDNGHYEDPNQNGDEENNEKGNSDFERHSKRRKLKNLISRYEFAPRVTAAMPLSSAVPPLPKFGRRNPVTDWTEQETFALLDAWGDKFVQLGRKSLRSEEWQEVAEKVSEDSNLNRTDTQCRNRLDTLKKKYKKEKMKLHDSTKWVYFKKMDVLMSSSSSSSHQGLSCGLDSGEYVFMSPEVYLNCANGLDEMRDSPGGSESSLDMDGDSDEPPPTKASFKEGSSSYGLLADSIQKFSETYEKIESSKRQQMLELEKMRMDFHRDLELQKREILEKAQAEIAKMHGFVEEEVGEEEGNEIYVENVSG